MKFRIRYGLGGGFGGAGEWEEIDAPSLEAAEKEAEHQAREVYESYEGMYGLRSTNDIMKEDGCDSDEAQSIYEEEMVSWLDYEAEVI